jgi:hypothetical protein
MKNPLSAMRDFIVGPKSIDVCNNSQPSALKRKGGTTSFATKTHKFEVAQAPIVIKTRVQLGLAWLPPCSVGGSLLSSAISQSPEPDIRSVAAVASR